jgi:hypothetical protein
MKYYQVISLLFIREAAGVAEKDVWNTNIQPFCCSDEIIISPLSLLKWRKL